MTAMHIGINALALRSGEYSGVHVAARGAINAVVGHAAPDDRFTLYVQRKLPRNLPQPGETVRHVPPFWPVGWRAGRITWEQFRLPARVFADHVDLLWCPAYVMPRTCLKPVVLSVHDLFALRQPEVCTRANRSHFVRMLPKSLARARCIVVPSDWVRQELVAYARTLRDEEQPPVDLGDVEERTRVIPWGVDERFAPVQDPAQRETVALRYGLPPRFVLYVGRVEPKKNVRRAVEAYFAAVMSKGLPHRLVLLGPRGWGEEKQVARLIRNLGLEQKAVCLGFVPDEDLPAIYSLADCLLFPSIAEGFGLPVLEAMACGTPVVASGIPPLAALTDGVAQLAPPEDLPGLRAALEAVLANPARARELADKGRMRARAFTWQAYGKAMVALFQGVILEDRANR